MTTPGARPQVVDRGKVGEQVPGLGWLELIGVEAGSGRLGPRLMSQQACDTRVHVVGGRVGREGRLMPVT